MKFETDFRNIITISENGRNIKIKYNDDDRNPYAEEDDDDRITSCSTSYNNKLDIFYFEVSCKHVRKYSSFAVGFITKSEVLKFAQLGWELGSIGYHGDDGQVYIPTTNEGILQYEKFGKGDIVGCGIYKGKIFFTKNGKFQAFVALVKKDQKLFPSISTWRSGEYNVNFGQNEFKFDLELIENVENEELELLYDSDDMVEDDDDEYETDSDYEDEE